MNFNETRKKTKLGYTFIELIIAMVILFLAVMVIGSIFPASFKSLLKSKQVTIAMTLAQQKLEQCLVNPKDYRTRVGGVVTNGVLTGTFSPEHPEYGYSIAEKTVTNKLKELKVEVYKLANRGIIDAATAQLVQQEAAPMVWKAYSYETALPDHALTTVLTKNINISQDGVIKIDAKGIFFNESYTVGTNFNMWIYCNGQSIPDAENGGGVCGAHRNTFGYTTTSINITKGSHTIQLIVIAHNGACPSKLNQSLMIITYYPGVQLQP